jgi:hypothetical protein
VIDREAVDGAEFLPHACVYLVTGVSGTGKAMAARTLRAWGHEAISLDADTRLCGWVDKLGQHIDRPEVPDAAWLAVHRWVGDATRLDELVDETRRRPGTTAWLFGQAANAIELADRFDAVFLLDIDQRTLRWRLADGSRGNDFGWVGDPLHAALASHLEFGAAWRRRGAHTIDATQPLPWVVEDLLMAGARAALDLS